ncbi:MAG: FIST signal transduction protein [Bacteroidota bacterium]
MSETIIGVGYSEKTNEREAAEQAVERAMQQEGLDRADLVLVFTTANVKPDGVIDGIRAVAGDQCRIAGGHSVGIITNDFLDYDGYQLGVAVFQLTDAQATVLTEGVLNEDGEREVGKRLGKQLGEVIQDEQDALLLLYDSVDRSEGYFQLNMGTPLLDGISEHLSTWPAIAGCGMSGDMKGTPGFQWVDDQLLEQQAVGVHFTGNLQMHTKIMHGCKPSGAYHTITDSKGALIKEIDGKPALDAIAEMMGHDVEEKWKEYSFFLTLGVNKGDKFAPFQADHYVNRLCLKVHPEERALQMFEPDLAPGTEFQLMRRELDFDYIREATQNLLDHVEPRTPVFALYIDCAGRAAAYSGMDDEEAAEVIQTIGDDIPLLGIYSGVELAKVQGKPQPLDWTGVLCVFSVE